MEETESVGALNQWMNSNSRYLGRVHISSSTIISRASACSFERIYFSRGSDRDIYQERKRLGEQLTPAILKAIDGDIDNTVFSYIPNTAEVAYYGINDTYLACKRELEKPAEQMQNCVRAIYAPFTVDEINKKIVEMLRPNDMQAPIELVFQSIEGLHEACPNHPGDWYFTGHYPTPGGTRLVNQAFVNYVEMTMGSR